jgi:hypothetical protein
VTPISKRHQTIVGAMGTQTHFPFLQPQKCTLGGYLMTHEFLYIPESPVAWMGQDLLSKIRAQIGFQEDEQVALSFGSGLPRVLSLITPHEEE